MDTWWGIKSTMKHFNRTLPGTMVDLSLSYQDNWYSGWTSMNLNLFGTFTKAGDNYMGAFFSLNF